MLWCLLVSDAGRACSEASWHAWECVVYVALFNHTMSVLIQETYSTVEL